MRSFSSRSFPVFGLAAFLSASLAFPTIASADDDIDDDGADVEEEAKRKPKKKGKARGDQDVEEELDVAEGEGGEGRDGARFRGGVSGEAGAMVIPDADLTLGVAGVQGQIGAQINHLVGVYWVPSFDIIFGKAGGVNFAGAVLVDFTIEDIVSLGVGPDVGAFVAIGSGAVATGVNYGGRFHFAVHPVFGRGENGIRRKAFSIGLDARFLGGPVAAVTTTDSSATVTGFIFQPMATIGYTAM